MAVRRALVALRAALLAASPASINNAFISCFAGGALNGLHLNEPTEIANNLEAISVEAVKLKSSNKLMHKASMHL